VPSYDLLFAVILPEMARAVMLAVVVALVEKSW
jgi:hypothetical protein